MAKDAFQYFDEEYGPIFSGEQMAGSPFRFVNAGDDLKLVLGIEAECLTRKMQGSQLSSDSIYRETLDAFSETFALNPNDDEDAYLMGETLIHEAQFERALEVFLMLSLQRAEDPRPHYLAGYCYSRLNRPEEALRCLRLAKQLVAKDPDAGVLEENIVHLLKEYGEG